MLRNSELPTHHTGRSAPSGLEGRSEPQGKPLQAGTRLIDEQKRICYDAPHGRRAQEAPCNLCAGGSIVLVNGPGAELTRSLPPPARAHPPYPARQTGIKRPFGPSTPSSRYLQPLVGTWRKGAKGSGGGSGIDSHTLPQLVQTIHI